MSLLEFEKISIKSAIESGDQMQYEYVDDSSSQFVIQRVFARPVTYIFHIPVSKPMI